MGNEKENTLFPARSMAFAVALASVLLFSSLSGRSVAQESAGDVPATQDTPITITTVGDIMMGSTYPVRKMPPNEGRSLFSGVKELLGNKDIVFGNLEGPLIDSGSPQKCKTGSTQCFEFVTPTGYANRLKEAGFTVLSIANNHTFDCGMEGLESTLETLKGSGLESCGGENITRFVIRGTKIAMVCFSFTSGDHAHSIHDLDRAGEIIADLKNEHDIVIVSFHGGAEGKGATRTLNREELFLGENRGNVVKFAYSVIDAGADMVIGHGPHVLRAMEIYRGKLIAYSLGNFLTYKMFNVRGISGISVILSAKIDPKTGDFLGGEITPIKLSADGIPAIDPKRKAISLLGSLMARDIEQPNIVIEDNGVISQKKNKVVQKQRD